ncbi:IS110 family transposase, partial [Streptococcus suis]
PEDIVRVTHRRHQVLQVTFPEIETVLSKPTGEHYWNLVTAFPYKDFVLDLSKDELLERIRQSTSKRISDKRVSYLAEKLIALANQSYCAVKKTSPM